jgi:hypothetical protein
MSKAPSPSIFRPKGGIDQSVLNEHKALVEEINRRKILRGAVSLGALTMLTGCSVTHTDPVQAVLKAVSQFNDRVQACSGQSPVAPTIARIRSSNRRAITVSRTSLGRCRDMETRACRLDQDKRSWTRNRCPLPEQERIIRHICVEGWDYIGQWSGVNLRHFLERIGADLTAKYVSFSAPTTITARSTARCIRRRWRPMRAVITDPFGFPLRLRGDEARLQEPKWITAIEVTSKYPGGYFEIAASTVRRSGLRGRAAQRREPQKGRRDLAAAPGRRRLQRTRTPPRQRCDRHLDPRRLAAARICISDSTVRPLRSAMPVRSCLARNGDMSVNVTR